ncbi:adhesion G protein-coupled receptor E5-like [Clavelina lepadiformis]|uniref:adhesion G protein-coupled receptor E5-like n=1 Tax=Clavelina lepadiformis TaxID=159417 RepID=UPI004042972C
MNFLSLLCFVAWLFFLTNKNDTVTANSAVTSVKEWRCTNSEYVILCLDSIQSAECKNLLRVEIGQCQLSKGRCLNNGFSLGGEFLNTSSCTGTSNCNISVPTAKADSVAPRIRCNCAEGYKWSNGSCKDINECLENRCDPNAECFNFLGSYRCSCKAGYVGDGTSSCRAFAYINQLFLTDLTSEEISQIAIDIEAAVSEPDSLQNPDVIKETVDFVRNTEDLVKNGKIKMTRTTFGNLVNITDSIGLAIRYDTARQKYRELRIGLAAALPALGLGVELDEGHPSFHTESNLFTLHAAIDFGSGYPRLSFQSGNNGDTVNVVVPESTVQKAWETNTNRQRREESARRRRSVFVYYKDDTFFYTEKNATSVISVDIGVNVTLRNLVEPVKIQHPKTTLKYGKLTTLSDPFDTLKTELQCSYWDFDKQDWLTDGCCLNISAETPECLCNHLTNFALIVKTENVPVDFALNLVSDVGCILSIVGLVITIMVHVLKRELLRRRPAKIIIFISANLCVSYLIFIVGISQTENKVTCYAISALLHYFLLVTWCWMTVYSYDMYLSLVKVFGRNESKFLRCMSLFAYGAPLVVVALTMGTAVGYFDRNQQNLLCNGVPDPLATSYYIAENLCWLRGYSLYLGFLLPMGLLLLYNGTIFVLVFREITVKRVQSSASKQTTSQRLTLALTMSVFMGVTWVFGYLVLISNDYLYLRITSWIFAILNSLQGFGLFILTSVRRAESRRVWWNPIQDKVASTFSVFHGKHRRDRGSYTVNDRTNTSRLTSSINLSRSASQRPVNIYVIDGVDQDKISSM